MKRITILLFAATILTACHSTQEDRVQTAVTNHLALYPEARLQDLYKAFFQAEFGAEHIVADTTSAGQYLNRELSITDHSSEHHLAIYPEINR